MIKKTNGDYVDMAIQALGRFLKPREYRNYIYETWGIKVNPSDVTKRAGSWVDRISGVDKYLERKAKEYIKAAGDNYMLALAVLKRVSKNEK